MATIKYINTKNSRMRFIGSMGLLLLFPMAAKSQYLPQLEDYKRWGLHFDKVWYLPAKADKKEGVYDIENYIMPGVILGFEYNFKLREDWFFFTGMDIDWLPFYNYDFNPYITKAELPLTLQSRAPDSFWKGAFASKDINSHSVLSIPIGISVKNSLSSKLSTIISASINTKIMFSGRWSLGQSLSDYQTGQSVTFFDINGKTNPNSVLYPCANLSAGINYMNKYSIVRLSLKIQKTVIPFFKGDYRFYNLAQSPDTYGTYKVQGDYFGLGITIIPRKIKTLRY